MNNIEEKIEIVNNDDKNNFGPVDCNGSMKIEDRLDYIEHKLNEIINFINNK